MALVPHALVQLLLGVLQPGREKLSLGQKLDDLHLIGDPAGVRHHHLVGLFLPQIAELLQHLIGGLEIQRQRCVDIRQLFVFFRVVLLHHISGEQDAAVDLVLRIQEMHVTCGAYRLAQLLAQADDGAVIVPQLLHGAHRPVSQHKHVVADRLDLQIIVEGGDALELLPILMAVRQCLKQFSRLAGRADDQTLPMGHQLSFGDDRPLVEIFQVGQGDQLEQVLQPQLVFRQQDDVLGSAVDLAAAGPQLQHLAVDLLEPGDAQFLLHLFEKGNQHVAYHGRIVAGPVVVESRQIQILGHNVQLELVELRQKILGQDQRIHISGRKNKSRRGAAPADEADVKLRVVGRQRPSVDEPQERLQRLPWLRGVTQHGVGDARQTYDIRRQRPTRIHKGLEPVGDLAVFQHHGADLRDGVFVHIQACGLNVKADDLVCKGLVLAAVYHHPIVQVVDKIALHAVKYFYFTVRFMPGIRE